MKLIALIRNIFSTIFKLKALHNVSVDLLSQNEKYITSKELLTIIKSQNNIVYYLNQSYDIYGLHHEQYIITLTENDKVDYTFDVIYYLLGYINKLSSSSFEETVERYSRIVRNNGKLSLNSLHQIQVDLKKVSGICVEFVELNTGENESKDISWKVDNTKKLKISSNSQETKKQVGNLEHKNSKIILESCSVKELLEIDGFDKEKAETFIQERKNGKQYYDIESFVSDYGLMPHQMIEIQDRLVFPAKPKNKIGRKIDL